MVSSITNITFERPAAEQTVPTQLKVRTVASIDTNGVVAVDYFFGLNPDAVAEVHSATITVGATGDLYILETTDPTLTAPFTAVYRQRAGDTASLIAARLAERINLSPHVRATASAGIITLTSEFPGRDLTVGKAGSTDEAKIVLAVVTNASGTEVERRVARHESQMTVASNTTDPQRSGIPNVETRTFFYQVNGTTALNPNVEFRKVSTGNTVTLDAFQTDANILRP